MIEQRSEFGGVRTALRHAECVGQWRVTGNGGQPPRQQRLFTVIAQALRHLAGTAQAQVGHFFYPLQQCIEATPYRALTSRWPQRWLRA